MERPPTPRELQRMGHALVYAAERGETADALSLLERGVDVRARDDSGYTALLWAARLGNLELVRALIARGAEVDAADGSGCTAVMWATRGGHDAVAQKLVASGADVRAADGKRQTPLHLAAARGDRKLAALFLTRRAELDAVDAYDDTPLTLAATGAHFELVQWLAERGADLDWQGNGGRTALLQAVMENRIPPGPPKIEIVERLLARGASLEIPDDYGWTPLMRAATNGDEELLRFLLARGAQLEVQDGQGQTAFHWAVRGGHLPAMSVLLDAGAEVDARDRQGRTALFNQMRDPDPEIVRFLLDRGADPNTTDSRHQPVIHEAVGKDRLDVVRLLVERGADPNAPDGAGRSPLVRAVQERREELAHALIELGARSTTELEELLGLDDGIDAPDDRGWTPLARAVRALDLGRAQLLLDAGANIEAAAADGMTPLMIAARSGQEPVLRLLLERGAAVHARDAQGETPLHYAVNSTRAEAVKLLLEAGAAVNARSSGGVTPLMLAVDDCGAGIGQILLEAGADPNLEDAHGRTALRLALTRRREDLVEALLTHGGADARCADDQFRSAADLAREAGMGDNARVMDALTPPPAPAEEPVPEEERGYAGVVVTVEYETIDQLPPEREVACRCDVSYHRPVFHDPTGWNHRVTACTRCGRVTCTAALVDEPHPHHVVCVGNQVMNVAPEALSWLQLWPRLAWGVWEQDRRVYFPRSLFVTSLAELAEVEQRALQAAAGRSWRERLLEAGVPPLRPPESLPQEFRSFAETWEGLQLTDSTPMDRLLELAAGTTWAAPFSQEVLRRRPEIMAEVAAFVASEEAVRYRVGLALLRRPELVSPAALAAVIERLRAAELDEAGLHPLLDLLNHLGAAAVGARPVLAKIAERLGGSNHYLRKWVEETRARLKPPRAPRKPRS